MPTATAHIRLIPFRLKTTGAGAHSSDKRRRGDGRTATGARTLVVRYRRHIRFTPM